MLSSRSQARLQGVHPALTRIVRRAIRTSPLDFMVLEGRRSLARQKELFKAGASDTLNSRHLTGHAVDLAVVIGRQVRWDWPLYHQLARAVLAAAAEWETPLEWGGHWQNPDGPHFQLPWNEFPVGE